MSSISLLIAAIFLIPLAIAGCSLAPWVPTRHKDLERINALLKLQSGSVFYDLGCGEGRVCRYIAQHNPDATVIGIEMALPLYCLARIRQWIRPIANLSYIYGNALSVDLSKANAVYTFALIRTINEKLKPKFLKELQSGSRIISYQFAMRDWPGMQQADHPHERSARLYVYEV